jgi:succinate dehydrogenase / fumarate reductase iron-sulfur subunit
MEVCPQFTPLSSYIGAAAISQVRLLNNHPTGRFQAAERLEALMGEGGLADCANAQNCVHACPKEIPLTESIAAMGRETSKLMLKRLLGG